MPGLVRLQPFADGPPRWGDRRIAELERSDLRDRQRRDAAVEKRVVRPQRLVDRPPADPCGGALAVGGERLRLRDRTVARRDPTRPKAAAPELDRVVEIDEFRAVGQLDRSKGERQTPPDEHRLDQPLAAETRQLLDDA